MCLLRRSTNAIFRLTKVAFTLFFEGVFPCSMFSLLLYYLLGGLYSLRCGLCALWSVLLHVLLGSPGGSLSEPRGQLWKHLVVSMAG